MREGLLSNVSIFGVVRISACFMHAAYTLLIRRGELLHTASHNDRLRMARAKGRNRLHRDVLRSAKGERSGKSCANKADHHPEKEE